MFRRVVYNVEKNTIYLQSASVQTEISKQVSISTGEDKAWCSEINGVVNSSVVNSQRAVRKRIFILYRNLSNEQYLGQI